MNPDEFFNIMSDASVIDEKFGAREIGIIFNISMMSQKDELNGSRHYEMSMVEFLEGFARVADRLVLPPIYAEVTRSSK
jgi:hypothetical protein